MSDVRMLCQALHSQLMPVQCGPICPLWVFGLMQRAACAVKCACACPALSCRVWEGQQSAVHIAFPALFLSVCGKDIHL